MDRLRVAWKRCAPALVPALVFLALLLAVFWRVWLGDKAFAWDAKYEYWGDIQFQVHSLAHGHLPMWNPYDRLGYPFYADPQAGTLYPLQWPLWGLAAIVGTPWWLVVVKIFLHFEIGALGMYALAGRRALPVPARYLAGVIFIFTYPVLHDAPSALTWSYAWTPWLLLAIEAWAARPDARSASRVALAAAMLVLAGAPACAFYGGLIAFAWLIVEVVRGARSAADRRVYLRAIAITAAIASALLAAIVAAQLIATAAYVAHTVRSVRDEAFFGASVMTAREVLGFAVPRLPPVVTYVGFGPLLWAAMLVIARRNARTLVPVGLIVLGTLCSFGNHLPVLGALAAIAPPFGFFRRAHRYLYVAVVPFALLAAEGLAWCAGITDAVARARLRRIVTVVGAVCALACAVAFAATSGAYRSAFGFGVAAAEAAAWTTWLVLRRPSRLRFLALAALTATVDIFIAGMPVVSNPDTVGRRPWLTRDARATRIRPLAYRIYDRDYFSCRPGTRLGLRDLGGYEGDPLALVRYDSLRAAVEAAPRELGHAGVRYLFEGDERPFDRLIKAPADLAAMTFVAPGEWEMATPAPEVAWYDAADVAPNAEAALAAVLAAPPGTRAVLEAGTLDAATRSRATHVDVPNAGSPGSDPAAAIARGSLVVLAADSLRATIDAPADGIVVILEMFYERGWTATVDGVATPIVPAQGFARGVLVGPGHHVIEMTFADRGYDVRIVLELLALLLAGMLALRRPRAA